MEKLTMRNLVMMACAAITALVTLILTPQLVENLDAKQLMVIQKLDGTLDCYTEPGPKMQWLGTVTTYPRQGSYLFDVHTEKMDTGKALQFNDGGTARLYGSVNWQMPTDCKQIVMIHKQFGSPSGIEERGVARMVNTAIQLSGNTMTSIESFAERKAELIDIINDQAQNGAFQMVTHQVERTNPITNQPEKVLAAEIVRDPKTGKASRQHGSILDQFGITLQPMSIEKLDYSTIVQEQIKQRQAAMTQVQVSQANAQKAIQAAITAEKEGQATAAKAKWEQETVKAKEVTKAQQEFEVASLAAKTAEQRKREQVLLGEGEAERKRLVMQADGALEKKLEAWTAAQKFYADALANSKQPLVPGVVMGQSGTGQHSSVQGLLDMLSVRTAKDLSLDMSMQGTKK